MNPSFDFLAGGGEAGARIRAHNWQDSPIGLPDTWPCALRNVLNLMLNSPESMYVVWGPQLTFFFNDAYAPLLGERLPIALGMDLPSLWPDAWDAVKGPLEQAFAGQACRFVDIPILMTRPTGDESTWWSYSYSPLWDDSQVKGVFCFTTETTDRVLAERRRDDDALALRAQRDRARASEASARVHAERVQLALAAGAIIGTWVWDLTTDRFTVDEAFAINFGLDPALGREGLSLAQVVDTVHPDDQQGLAAAIKEVIGRGGRYAHQYRVRRRDGKYYWLEANGQVELSPEGEPLRFPGVLIDVDERRALTRQRDKALIELRNLNETLEQRVSERTRDLMQAEEALRQSQKMEAVGQLTGGLAHDFNNLLAGISGALELVNMRIAQGRLDDIKKYVSTAQGATLRAAALTHRLLAFSRRQTLSPKPTDVNRLVADMLDLVRRTVGPGIDVQNDASPGLWPALVDASQLENSLLNLCINARDAMPNGGKLIIHTSNVEIGAATAGASPANLSAGQYLCLRVSDNGCGMTEAIMAKAFDPFFTTKPIGQGTGLGLSMIYGFATQSGGRVHIDSVVAVGTVVSLYLPRHLAEPEADPGSDARSGTPAPAQDGETVLVVDDEPTVRMLVVEVLEELGYTAIEAADSASGLQILTSDVKIDLLVSDVGLPGGMNGRQMADAARVVRPELKVLFITGFAENAMLTGDQLDVGMAVLTKPFSLDALAAQIRTLIVER